MQAELPVVQGEEEFAAQELIPLTERWKPTIFLSAYLLGSFLCGPEPILIGAPHLRSISLRDLYLADDSHPMYVSIINHVGLTTPWGRPLSIFVIPSYPSVCTLQGDS